MAYKELKRHPKVVNTNRRLLPEMDETQYRRHEIRDTNPMQKTKRSVNKNIEGRQTKICP